MAGSILLFLKRKIGIFVSLAGIVYMVGFGLYSMTQYPFNQLSPPDFGDYLSTFTGPFGYLSLGIGVILLIIGWKKVKWGTSTMEIEITTESKEEFSSRKSEEPTTRWRPLRILLFTALPIASVILLYFVYLSDVRSALRSIAGI